MIQSGELKIGEKLVTEGEICELLEISRTTVRQSMDKLVKDGLIVRQRGRGSFVADSKLQRPVNYLYNFTENMNRLGVTPSSIILKSSVDFVNDSVRLLTSHLEPVQLHPEFNRLKRSQNTIRSKK